MKDFYRSTRLCIDRYNELYDKIINGVEELTDEEDEFIDNFCLYLSHALIKDTGTGQMARAELSKMANIINDVIR